MSNTIIIGGKAVELKLPNELPPRVLTWNDHGVQFRAGEGFNKSRKRAIDLAVWHWTGGEEDPLAMAETLRNRKLGVEFAISRVGEVYQFADPLVVDTADAGIVNARSVGIEIVSWGMQTGAGWKVPVRGADRIQQHEMIHGVKCLTASFYTGQLRAAMHLAEALSSSLGIARQVPMAGAGDDVLAVMLTADALAAFRGHLGHYHFQRDRCDPGPAFLRQLKEQFNAGLGVS